MSQGPLESKDEFQPAVVGDLILVEQNLFTVRFAEVIGVSETGYVELSFGFDRVFFGRKTRCHVLPREDLARRTAEEILDAAGPRAFPTIGHAAVWLRTWLSAGQARDDLDDPTLIGRMTMKSRLAVTARKES